MAAIIKNRQDIISDLSGRFHQWISSEESSFYVLATEYIRHYLYFPRTEAIRQIMPNQAVHILAISNRLKNQFVSLYSEEFLKDKNPTKEILDCLQGMGDVQHIGNGYWIATAPHFITHPAGVTFLVGGAPTSYLEKQFDITLRSSSLARVVHDLSAVTAYKDNDAVWQNYSEWFTNPYTDTIEQWTERLFTWAKENFIESLMDDLPVEVYNSKAKAKPFQLQRWQLMSDLSFLPNHPMLCRIRGRGPTIYLLADIQEVDGELRIAGEVGLHKRYRTQILYALDNYDKSNTICDVSKGEKTFTVKLYNYLPEPIKRLFYAFSQNPFYAFDSLPHEFIFHSAFYSTLTKALEICGIQIKD